VASIAELRDGLAANLATIPGLRVSATIPDNPSPPIAIVQLARVQYHQDFQRGMTEYNFAVQVVVGRVDERTAQRNPTALDRINVRMLSIFLKKTLLASVQAFIFEPNDPILWGLIEDVATSILSDVKSRRGITEYSVTCDATTNTPARIDRNELWCKVVVRPTKTAEAIVFELNLTSQSGSIN